MDLYDVFDDQIYVIQGKQEVLKFRLGMRFFIPVSEKTIQSIEEGLKN